MKEKSFVSFIISKMILTFNICFNYVMIHIVAGLWTVMTLGLARNKTTVEDEESETLLANQSLLFILILANHCTSDKGLSNPYRQALFSFTNSQGQFTTNVF